MRWKSNWFDTDKKIVNKNWILRDIYFKKNINYLEEVIETKLLIK